MADTDATTDISFKIGEESDYTRIIIISVIGIIIVGMVQSVSQIAEIKKNWDKYRCKPQYMALAPIFGKDTAENFNYCLQNVMNDEAGSTLAPIYKVLFASLASVSTLLESTNSLRLQLATLVGGIVKTIQQFVDRFNQFGFAVRNTAIRLKLLMYRVYGIMMAMIYMGISGIVTLQNLPETALVKFMLTFCFPPNTPIYVHGKGHIPISHVRPGDRLAHGAIVTGRFAFSAKGQQMVRLGHVRVSTNHFVRDPSGNWVMAGEHVHAEKSPDWEYGPEFPLICLNTSDHTIHLGGYEFSDYDETEDGDEVAAKFVERRINGSEFTHRVKFKEYGANIHPNSLVLNGRPANSVLLGETFSNGCKVIGLVDKFITQAVKLPDRAQTIVTPSTLVWSNYSHKYIRAIDIVGSVSINYDTPVIFRGFIVTPHSTIVTDSGLHLRDYIEVLSPDTEEPYSKCLREEGADQMKTTVIRAK